MNLSLVFFFCCKPETKLFSFYGFICESEVERKNNTSFLRQNMKCYHMNCIFTFFKYKIPHFLLKTKLKRKKCRKYCNLTDFFTHSSLKNPQKIISSVGFIKCSLANTLTKSDMNDGVAVLLEKAVPSKVT